MVHAVESDFDLLQCYSVNVLAAGPSKAQAFSEKMLLHIFYVHPCDAL